MFRIFLQFFCKTAPGIEKEGLSSCVSVPGNALCLLLQVPENLHPLFLCGLLALSKQNIPSSCIIGEQVDLYVFIAPPPAKAVERNFF